MAVDVDSSSSPSRPLFSPSLISSEASSSISPDYIVRPLARDDHGKGFLDVLRVLTSKTGDYGQEEFAEVWDEMAASRTVYYPLVIEFVPEAKIVGTGILVAERKFIFNRGKVGHIEEISIAREHQGKGLGKIMMRALDSVGVNLGCIKNQLNCSDKNVPFYEKCGYRSSGLEMTHDF